MLVGEQSPAPRVVAGLRKLHPALTPGPVPTPLDSSIRISGVLRQYYNDGIDEGAWTWVRASVRGGCLLAWRDGTLPRRAAARLPLRHLHLRPAPLLPNAFQLSRLRDDTTVATFQACNATEYARWVRALCIEILGQTPLPQVRFLDVLSAADTRPILPALTPVPPKPPPRARRRLLTAETTLPRARDASPAATDEGIDVEDDYDSASDRSDERDVIDSPTAPCTTCNALATQQQQQHHTLPRRAEPARHRYLKRWETSGEKPINGRNNIDSPRRKGGTLPTETRARSCSPHAAAAKYVPVRERRALFESLTSRTRSSEQLSRVSIESSPEESPRRAASLAELPAPPSRSVSDLRRYFESVARSSLPAQRLSAPPLHTPRGCVSLTCA